MIARLIAIAITVLAVGTCRAEDATLLKDTVMRADRSLVALKAGTVVELVGRAEKTISIRYKGQLGTIPAGALAPAAGAPPVAPTPARKSLVVDHPQSTYGNLVKKAETNAAKHEDSLVKPADDVMADPPAK